MRQNRKKTIKLFALALILLLGIGFAALAANLKITGTLNVSRTSWDVHFENVQITQGSVTANPAPTSDDSTTTEMAYTINFTKPGDYFEFTTDIVNEGTIDAMVDVVSNNAYQNASSTTPISLPTYLTSTVTYDDGVEIVQNQELLHNTSEKIKVRVEFKKDIQASDLPSSGDTTIVFKFIGDYKQKDDNSIPVRVDFSTASWDDITTAYTNNPLSLKQSMINGTTKEIQLDLDNDGTPETTNHLRIANLSTPQECSTTGFSQSACGLVIEFADIITTHRMNPFISFSDATIGAGSNGGWEYSDMRAYLNSTTYAYENIDYSTSGIFNSLPSDLRSKIINTTVVSDHNNMTTNNYTTIDKLYLFSAREIWEKDENSTIDTGYSAWNLTRQLDYYKEKGVRTNSYGESRKQYNETDSYWFLRSANLYNNYSFTSVHEGGFISEVSPSIVRGVSPAFRIA